MLAERGPFRRHVTAAVLERQDEIATARINELARAIVAELARAMKG